MTKSKEPKTEEQKAGEWLKRTAKAYAKSTDRKGVIFTRQGKDSPVVQAVNAVTERERRRKIN